MSFVKLSFKAGPGSLALIRTLDSSKDIIEKVLVQRIELGIQEVVKEVVDYTPVFDGDLAKSIFAEVRVETGIVFAEVDSDVEYAGVVEEGAEPFFPRVENGIEKWANAHGINPWQLAISISRGGIRGQKMFARAYDTGRQKFFEEIGDLGSQIAIQLDQHR